MTEVLKDECNSKDCFAYDNIKIKEFCILCSRNKLNENIKHTLKDKYQTHIQKGE